MIGKLQQYQATALAMGGEEKIAKQHAKGRLTARERIAQLLDDGSFDETGQLVVSDLKDAQKKSPADGKICGFGHINQREVMVSADDVTVFAGAGGRNGVAKAVKLAQYAADKGLPIIHLGDAGGARVPDIMGSAGMMSMVYPIAGAPRNRRVPAITTIMGECYGGPTWTAQVSDIVIQIKGTVMCVGGSSILTVATGEQSTDDELGGWELHAEHTGLVDLFAADEQECLWLVQRVLSYLPSSAQQLPPVLPCDDPVDASLDAVFDIVPTDPKQTYDMHALVELIADADSVLELKPDYDPSLITALARLNGRVVGILANNPLHSAGAMGPGACEKATSFICLCDSFHIPLVFLHDTPGFLVGKAAEQRKMPQRIMGMIEALQKSTVPRVSVIVRKSYGMAHCNMSGGNMGNDRLLAWPTADVSFMAPEVAVNVAYGRKLAALDDADKTAQMQQMFIDHLNQGSEPWEAAQAGLIDQIIDPKDTRKVLIRTLARAQGQDSEAGRSQRLLANWPRMF